MKILCVIDSLASGGAQRQLINLAIGFKERGHEIFFLTYHPLNFFKDPLDELKIPVVTIIEPSYLKRIYKMRATIRTGNYDAVLSFLEAPSFICELAGLPYRKWKLVVGERNADPKILSSFRSKFFRYMHLFADSVVANSEANVEMIRKVIPFMSKNKYSVIYNIVDTNIWKPSDNYIVRENGKTNIVIAAGHQYSKNSRNLVEALNLLTNAEKSLVSVKWYGSNRPDQSLIESKELINHYLLNDVIEFLPPVKNIAEKIYTADCCALFSYHEGLPNALCEGMALGKPIIATKVSDLPKFIDEELGGYFCEKPSAESIVGAIRKILHSSDEQLIAMGQHNRRKAILLFDKRIIINRYLEVLQKALN